MIMRIVAVLALMCAAQAAQAADLIVTVTGIPQPTGIIRVVIIDDPDGVAHQESSRNVDAAQSRDGTLTTRFEGMAPSRFAVVALAEPAINHAVELAVKGAVAPPRAVSQEIRFNLVEPSTTVVVPLALVR